MSAKRPTQDEREPDAERRFDLLLVGHDPQDPPEATLVLAAIAAFNGLKADGTPMSGAQFGRMPTQNEVAQELGLHVGAVKRGVSHLRQRGAVSFELGGLSANAESLRERWERGRQRIRLPRELRELGLRAKPLLLVALVAGQKSRSGHLMLGVEFLSERLGLPRRTVERLLATARRKGAIHTWSRRTGSGSFRQQMWIALGPSQSGGSDQSQSGGSDRPRAAGNDAPSREPAVDASQSGGHPIAKRRSPHRKAAVTPSQSGGRHPDCPTDCPSDHHPDGAGAPGRSGDPRCSKPAAPRAAAAEPVRGQPLNTVPSPDRQRQFVEDWVRAFARKGIERMEPQHAAQVAGLLDQFSPPPSVDSHMRRAALRRERLKLAERVIVWCPSPERLGRWLVRVSRRYGVENLGAYLRRASERGDPGTVLSRDPADCHDFTPRTERQLEGKHIDEVALILAAGDCLFRLTDPAARSRLREELRQMLAAGRVVAAQTTLLKLLGNERSDAAITDAVGDACTLAQAKELLAA